MKHVTFADKSMLVGDEAADLLMRYASLLANRSEADTVDLRVYGVDGSSAVATFLLDSGAPLMAETVASDIPEPDNSKAASYLREKIGLIIDPPPARMESPSEPSDINQYDFD